MKDTIAERAEAIVEEFSLFDDWMGKYEHLIEQGRSLPLIEDAYRTDEYKVRGCQAQVWLRAERDNGRIVFKADSDALITKGLIALLVRVLNGQPPEAIAHADLSFLDRIGMKEHLSPTRKNGLDAMIRQMKLYAVALGGENVSAAPRGQKA
ncbi:SufE family protein [Rhodocaloribacter litoris]|uniref:SufE family protein n=1 Tax=Rhodocaloribacter litoris TaxID=2558931 RepID=UPI001E50C79F|nr:SufE family protein [Rhodocaloribacter litoris]